MTGGMEPGWMWAIGLIVFAVGIACGAGLVLLLSGSSRRAAELQDKLDRLQQEFSAYRDQVEQHFRKTSELVQTMTESYRNVYEHLATGSQALCQDPVSTPQLDIPKNAMLDTDSSENSAEAEPAGTDNDMFSDAETDTLDELGDAGLGDAPRVPKLDGLYGETRTTPQPPSA
ncbi:MAG TPA: DUF1043 family protein [Gammaproteobacteria bacterium]|nr:DUF1043 family protein [Gammaproteobacteria bacterium]